MRRIWRDALRRWDDENKPTAIARHRELADIDLGALDDDALRDQLHQRVAWLTDMAYQHHRFNSMAMLPVGDFILHAVGWTGRAAGRSAPATVGQGDVGARLLHRRRAGRTPDSGR